MSDITTVLYPVNDLAAATALFTTVIGEPPMVDSPYYVGWQVAGKDIGLVPKAGPMGGDAQGLTGPTPFWHVEDIHAAIKALVDGGATPNQEPRNVGGGRLVGSVTDPSGNVIGLTQESA